MGIKREQTFERIIQAAMKSFSIYGDRETTFQTIADIAGVSQPLVARYFGTRQTLLPTVIDRFLVYARAATNKALEKSQTPTEKLKAYIRVSIEMFRDKPEIYKVYLLLHYQAGFDNKFTEMNSEIKIAAVDRIATILREGIADQTFQDCNVKLVSKIIHSSLVGVVLGITTETPRYTDAQLQKTLEDLVFSFLKK